MRSLYARILLWCFGTLILSLVAFLFLSVFISRRTVGKGGPFTHMAAFQVEEASRAYETGGREALAAFFARLQQFFPDEHYLLDSKGVDILTGHHRPDLLKPQDPPMLPPVFSSERLIINHASPDGRYHLIIIARPAVSIYNLLPYYALVLAAVALLLAILAANLASPIRHLSRTVEAFGRGDLEARTFSTRRDEIGELSRAFDVMASRIQTLLTAERRLLQDISHELRSPLARLSFAVELARDSQDRDASIKRIRREIDRLTSLVSSLLQVTRAEGDPETHKTEIVLIGNVVEEVLEDCRIEAAARQCSIEFAATAECAVQGDLELLRRAFENVTRNAVGYSPPDSVIEIRLHVQPAVMVLTVRDFGPGVPEDSIGKLFTPFFRVDDSRDSSSGGLGLGLAIAHRAVSLHHGRIWAENAHPGLRVSIELPSAFTGAARTTITTI